MSETLIYIIENNIIIEALIYMYMYVITYCIYSNQMGHMYMYMHIYIVHVCTVVDLGI